MLSRRNTSVTVIIIVCSLLILLMGNGSVYGRNIAPSRVKRSPGKLGVESPQDDRATITGRSEQLFALMCQVCRETKHRRCTREWCLESKPLGAKDVANITVELLSNFPLVGINTANIQTDEEDSVRDITK